MTEFVAATSVLFLLVGIWMLLEHSLRRTAHLPRLPFGADADPDWSSSRWSSSR